MESLMDFVKVFFIAFMPLFFAVNALGIVPIFISMTNELSLENQRSLLKDAILAAFIVSIFFLLAGQFIFRMMGITTDDFRIAGGLVLLLIGLLDLINSKYEQRKHSEIGIVPIGVPLIIGPGALTTIMVLLGRVGYVHTLLSLIVNLAIAWLIFYNSYWIVRLMGTGGTRAFGKIASLFLIAIAVMMIRVGLSNFLGAS